MSQLRLVTRGRVRPTVRLLPQSRNFSSVVQGAKYTPSFRQYVLMSNGEIGSYFHDVPLSLDENAATLNMVVEIPRWTNAKFEISKDILFNPIVQDSKNGKLRYVDNIFPFRGYMHNYGAIPQTWEDPTREEFAGTGLKGDNDPLDCCEIGSRIIPTGTVKSVRLLGSLGLIDDGELDWKVIVISTEDPLAERIFNLGDVEKYMPGLLTSTREWFRNYKIPQGKPANSFTFNEEYKDVSETLDVVKRCHESWRRLIDRKGFENTSKLPLTERSGYGIFLTDKSKPDGKLPSDLETWHYL